MGTCLACGPAPAPKENINIKGPPELQKPCCVLVAGGAGGRRGEVGWVTMGRVGKNRSERRRTLPASATISLNRNQEKVAGT